MSEQLELFDQRGGLPIEHTSEGEPILAEWSYSRREVLERCPRWYYYQYYGANARTARAEPQKQTLRFLKTLSSRHQRVGDIVHRVIRTYLTRLREGEAWSLERVLRWARDIYRRDVAYSRHYRRGEPPPDDSYVPVLLLEFYYAFENAEELQEVAEGRLLAALAHFVTSPEFAHFRAGGCKAEAIVERRVSLRTNSFSLRGQIDLAYPDDGRVVVVDWKTGGANGVDDSLQLLSYALGAMQEFTCAPSSIDLYRVHLADNTVSRFGVREQDVRRAKARILQDGEKMQALEGYGRSAVADAFTPCGQPRACALCPFQEICPQR